MLSSAVHAGAMLLAVMAAVQQPQFPVDSQTGRAIGAHEMTPADVKSHLDSKAKLVIIDVREPDSFAKETIKGAINIPIGDLEKRLAEFPKDTLLVFT